MTGSLRLCQALTLLVCGRLLELKFRWHHRRHQRHERGKARHFAGMTRTLERREDLCARYGGRPGPPAPRSGSGVPILPLPSHQVAGSSVGTAAAFPSRDEAAPRPGGVEGRHVAARGCQHPP